MTTLLHTLASGTTDLEAQISETSIQLVMIASLILVVLLGIASLINKKKSFSHYKKPLFIAIAATILLPSFYMMGSTVYVNVVSESGGPVHWHTDIEFWVCDEEIELRKPFGFLSNKIGTSTYHEHDDKRMHLEGVVVEKAYDASLDKFMNVIGGKITDSSLIIPTDENPYENDVDGDKPADKHQSFISENLSKNINDRYILSVENGQLCHNGEPAELQTFLLQYKKSDDTYTQTKLSDPASYVMRDESIVPPGDCLIVEFDSLKDRTDKLCQQYGVRDSERCTEFGVSTYNEELCNIRQLDSVEGTQ